MSQSIRLMNRGNYHLTWLSNWLVTLHIHIAFDFQLCAELLLHSTPLMYALNHLSHALWPSCPLLMTAIYFAFVLYGISKVKIFFWLPMRFESFLLRFLHRSVTVDSILNFSIAVYSLDALFASLHWLDSCGWSFKVNENFFGARGSEKSSWGVGSEWEEEKFNFCDWTARMKI